MSNKRDREQDDITEEKHPKILKMENLTEQMKLMHAAITDGFTETNTKFRFLDDTLNKIVTELKTYLERLTQIEANILELQQKDDLLESAINELNQFKLASTFIISGLTPAAENSKPFPIVKKIANNLGLEITENDVKNLYVVNHRNQQFCHISGTFYDQMKCDIFMKKFRASRKNKQMLVQDVITIAENDSRKSRPIYLRTEQTLYTKKLLAQAKSFPNVFKYVWEQGGRVLTKKELDSKIVELKSFDQLKKMTA